jgi:hypothetical protein
MIAAGSLGGLPLFRFGGSERCVDPVWDDAIILAQGADFVVGLDSLEKAMNAMR